MAHDNDPLSAICREFDLLPDTFKAIVQGFKAEYDHGLRTASAVGLATMIPSFITRLPTGKETGTFLSLDLGGTNMRVSAVQLLGNGKVNVVEVKKTVSDELRTGTVGGFFDWIADAVQELVDATRESKILPSPDAPLVMGVCWSFPLDQSGIASGTILRMGKGFTLDKIEGQDLIQLFQEAFTRKGLKVSVVALLNDAVGTLVAHAYSNPLTRAAFIYGTGVNASYAENVDRIRKLNANPSEDTIMLINTELDIFGSSEYLPLTRFDKALDAGHSQPGFQVYEKMMSGAYLGELVRRVSVELISQRSLFDGNMPTQLSQPWSFTTEAMSSLEGATQESWPDYFAGWTFPGSSYKISSDDMTRFLQVCRAVSSRAATLAAAAIVSIIEQQKLTLLPGDIVIGVNGSTYEKYPEMPERILVALTDWFGHDTASRIRLELAKDGGSIGGALVAMLYKDSTHTHPKIKCSGKHQSHVSMDIDTCSESMDNGQMHEEIKDPQDLLPPSCMSSLIRHFVRPVRQWFENCSGRQPSTSQISQKERE